MGYGGGKTERKERSRLDDAIRGRGCTGSCYVW